jgi:4-amino-4-deoxy-L-arabinose transferase-like glycosyltransferase
VATPNQARRNKNTARRSAASATPTVPWGRWERWAGPTLVALAFVAMMCWTWEAWADVIIDFGRELYIPWRLVEGEVLYRDLAHFNGPLSPYVNSLWFRLFGTSLRVLSLANLTILVLLLALLYSLVARMGSRTSAFLASMTFVLLFAFSELGYNLNYVCPYSHEMTHGLLLSLLAILFVRRFVRDGRPANAGLCGLCVGAVFLTKPEIFLAAFPATAVGLAMALWLRRPAGKKIFVAGGTFAAAVLAPPLLSLCLLSLAMPLSEALAGTLGGFRWVFSSEITALPFYRRLRGTYDLRLTGQRFFVIGIGYALLIVMPAVLGVLWRKRTKGGLPAALAFFAVAVALLWRFLSHVPWAYVFLPLPLVVMVAICGLVTRFARSRSEAEHSELVVPISFAIFSLLLTAKVFLSARIDNYGFVLAAPGMFLAVAFLWDWLPRALDARGGTGLPLRAGMLAALVVANLAFLQAQKIALDLRTVRVGTGGDAMWWNTRGQEVNRVLDQIETQLPPDGTFAVAPEGIMLNYLTRRKNPTHYISYMPLEMLLFGEVQMIAGFAQSPPDAVLVPNRDLAFYDLKPFGEGYAMGLKDWLIDHYQPVDSAPVEPGMFHITFLKRRQAAAAPTHNAGDENAIDP